MGPRKLWLFVACVLVGILGLRDRPKAAPAAVFHAIGDIPGGGVMTIIRDATHSGGVVYAVGGAVGRNTCGIPSVSPCPFTDTPIIWRSDTGVIQPLPDFVTNTSPLGLNGANAITPTAAFVASQARLTVASNGVVTPRPVRVDTSVLPWNPAVPAPASANLNLNDTFSPPLTTALTALAISSNGAIVYGAANGPVPGTLGRTARFDTTAPSGSLFIPTLASPGFTADTQNPIAPRGTSALGDVAVGSSFNPGPHKAYRYEFGVGNAPIPLLSGGTFNDALAVSPNGNLVLVTGNSSAYPNGEAYVYNAGTGSRQPLGSPNTFWQPGGRLCTSTGGCQPATILTGGISADGSIVALNFFGNDGEYAYVHNTHGWFHLASVLGANGIDLAAAGWEMTHFRIQGMSSDGTLVFGSGDHNGKVEGFVAEFDAGVLAAFDPTPTTPPNTSLVGAWTCGDSGITDGCVLVFTADGAYYQIEGSASEPESGFERGAYSYDGSLFRLSTIFDSNGSAGLSDVNGTPVPLTVVGDVLMSEGATVGRRVSGSAGTINGPWIGGDATKADSSVVIVFTPEGQYLFAQDLSGTGSSRDSIEIGSYAFDSGGGTLVTNSSGGVDQNGDGGLSDGTPSPATAALTANGLGLVFGAGAESFAFARVIDPARIPSITNATLSASGVQGQAFSYAVTATNTVTFSASGLPAGLGIDEGTGAIGGIPTVGGQFAVTIKASSAEGVSDIETLTLTFAIPTAVGTNVTVEPVVTEGQGAVTMTFDQVTGAGTTTVTVLDLDESSVPPPGSVDVAGVVYEVTTTASFEGLVNLCFSYAGIDFGGATPRLFHFENGVWVDITTSVDPGTQTICGATTSLSPFAVLKSNIIRTGFYAPVNPLAGFLNTVKGGSTVPLKFNVSVNGVNQTSTEGITTTVQMVSCDTNAPEDEVEPAAVTGNAGLRYDGTQFIFNWKVPRTTGCYMVRVTTVADGLALTARFKVR